MRILLSIFCIFLSQLALARENLDRPPQRPEDKAPSVVWSEYILSQITYNKYAGHSNSPAELEEALVYIDSSAQDVPAGRWFLATAQYNYDIGTYERAWKYALKANHIFDQSSDTYLQIRSKLMLASLHRRNKDLTKSFELIEEVMVRMKGQAIEYPYLLSFAKMIKADVVIDTRKKTSVDEALRLYHEAIRIAESTGSVVWPAIVKQASMRAYKAKYFLSKNIPYLGEVDSLAAEVSRTLNPYDLPSAKSKTLLNLAQMLSIRGLHKEATEPALKALAISKKSGDLYGQRYINQMLFVGYSIQGRQEEAMASNRVYVKLQDSLFNMEKRQLMAEADRRFKTQQARQEVIEAKQQAQIARLESQRNRNTSILLGILALGTLGFVLIWMSKQRSKRQVEITQLELAEATKRLVLEQQNRDIELKALKSQMNPHFIFNALNSIQEYIVSNEKKLASSYLVKFSRLIRMYLEQSQESEISLEEEMIALQLYLGLESIRFENDFDYNIITDPSLDLMTTYLPPLFIQPYIENAIKHGLMHKRKDRKLDIQFLSTQESATNTLVVIIKDNGIGRKESQIINDRRKSYHRSFASKATEHRVNLLNSRREQPITVEIKDLYNNSAQVAAGTEVIIKIPQTFITGIDRKAV